MCLTVETVVAGNRERDLRTGLTIPPKISLAGLAQFAMRPRWCVAYLLGEKFSLPNVGRGGGGELSTLAKTFGSRIERNLTWASPVRIVVHCGSTYAIQGLPYLDASRFSTLSFVTAVLTSNHRGPHIDVPPPP